MAAVPRERRHQKLERERLYRAADGWLFVAAQSMEQLRGIDELADAIDLAECFLRRPAAVCVERLSAAGIGAHALRTPEEAMRDEWALAHGVSRAVESSGGTWLAEQHAAAPAGSSPPRRIALRDE